MPVTLLEYFEDDFNSKFYFTISTKLDYKFYEQHKSHAFGEEPYAGE